MRVHRVVALLALVAFIPTAGGCSKTVTREIETNPRAPVAAGEPVPISAYTDRDGMRHVWDGTVQAAGADSLVFVRTASGEQWRGTTSAPDTLELRLSRQDVVSVELPREDVLASSFVVWAVAIGAMVLFGVILGATRTGDSAS